MKNIGLNTYYDDVTISGGTGKTITVPAVVIGLFATGIDKSISINVELPLNSILELVKSIFPCP